MKFSFYKVLAVQFLIMLTCVSCGGPKLSVADRQMSRGEYFNAARTYRAVYNSLTKRDDRQLKGEVAFRMAEAHRKLSQWGQAEAAYRNSIRLGYPDSTARINLAEMLVAEGKYSQAADAYGEYLQIHPDSKIAITGLNKARWAESAKKQSSRYIVRKDRIFNTQRSEFSPMLQDGTLYFTTTNEKVKGNERSDITGMKMSDIWMSRKNEQNRWMAPEPIEGDINTDMDEGICSFSPDGSVMYFTRAQKSKEADTSVGIYTSHRNNARWDEPERFVINGDTISNFGHPAVSPSGEYLYFTCDLPGMGGYDICRINLKHPERRPENLGCGVNTEGDEKYPYLLTDSIMYFSSDGHPGFGGLDIFKAVLSPDGEWKVSNMGMPINSPGDDFGITFDRTSDIQSGFFSSNRNDRRGYDNIYSFELPDLKVRIDGWVTDHDDEPVKGAVVRIAGEDGTLRRTASGANGEFTFKLQPGVKYIMMAGAKGYLNARKEFTTDTAETDALYEIEFVLASVTKPNILDNIFYDFDKASLRPESKKALDGLVKLLKENPNITIEMASHTDRTGTEEYNQNLSERRARSVVEYLIAEGIDSRRLQYHGFGKSRPKTVTVRDAAKYPQFREGDILTDSFIEALTSESDREAADQINRRTEFSVLSVDYNLY